jgi:hypothetical protein
MDKMIRFKSRFVSFQAEFYTCTTYNCLYLCLSLFLVSIMNLYWYQLQPHSTGGILVFPVSIFIVLPYTADVQIKRKSEYKLPSLRPAHSSGLLFIYLFIHMCIHWAISPSCPLPPPYPPSFPLYPLTSRQNPFCSLLQFCWRKDISNNKKDSIFASLTWGYLYGEIPSIASMNMCITTWIDSSLPDSSGLLAWCLMWIGKRCPSSQVDNLAKNSAPTHLSLRPLFCSCTPWRVSIQ